MLITTAGGGAIAGALLGGVFGGGGAQQTQTQNREPWAPAQPWLKDQISKGQSLQNYYGATPFNPAQSQAFGNMADQSAYIRNLIPSLLGQMSGGRFFDRSNMGARPTPFNFMGQGGGQAPSMFPPNSFFGQALQGSSGGGLLGAPQGVNPTSTMPNPASLSAPAPAALPAAPAHQGMMQTPFGWMSDQNNFGV